MSSWEDRYCRHHLLFALNWDAKVTETAQEIYEAYGQEATFLKPAQNWFKRLKKNRNLDLADTHSIGRPVELDEERLDQIIHEDQRQTLRRLTEIMECSHNTMERHPHLMEKVQKLDAWVPHALNDNNENQRSTTSASLLARHRSTHGHKQWLLYWIIAPWPYTSQISQAISVALHLD